MAERQIRHVEDVFSGKIGGEQSMTKSKNILDRKSSFNMFKNKPAPKPPSGQAPLPRIGNYQPKILLQSPTNEKPQTNDSTERTVTAQVHDPPIELSSRPLVIGDKNIPLQIESSRDETPDDTPVPAQRRKRRAPSAPSKNNDFNMEPTSISHSFERSTSQRSDEQALDIDFEEQGGDIDFSSGIDNPAYSSRDRKVSSSSRPRSESSSSWQGSHIATADGKRDPGITYPYIPPPDYDDEELTMMFEDEEYIEPAIDYNTTKRNSTSHLYKEYEGEDFGRYMQEDDYEFDAPRRMPRPPPNGRHYVRKGKAPSKPQKLSNTDKKSAKSKKKQAEKDMKRNTIRDFTFSDSKIGWGDRTVKSTSAKGRYIKHNKDRKRVDNPEMFGQDSGPGSYEEFLRIKNGIPLESPNSSDSGVDTSEDKQNMDMYIHSQPKQMRYGNADHKPSVWQRLTWKFRKSVNISRMESERL